MIALLTRLGLSQPIAKAVAYVAIPALIIGAFYLLLDAYGDSRYREGKKDANAAWQAASDKLIEKSQAAGTKADKAAAARQADFVAKQEDEKERIEHALDDGSSPLDVLFSAAD